MLQNITRSGLKLFLLFWVSLSILYALSWNGGFYTDFIQKLDYYGYESLGQYLKAKGGPGGYNFYQYAQVLTNHVIVGVIGLNPLAWYLLFTASFAVTGLLTYRFLVLLFDRFRWQGKEGVALAAVFLILVNPINAEVQFWRACQHYFITTSFIFGILVLLLRYLDRPRMAYLWGIYIIYALSTTTIELFYFTPVFIAIFTIALYWGGNINLQQLKQVAIRIFLPVVFIWLLYFLLHRYVYGGWIAHYTAKPVTAAAALGDAPVASGPAASGLSRYFYEYVLHLFKADYLFHLFGMEYLLPISVRTALYEVLDKKVVWAIVTAVLAFLAIGGLVVFKRAKPGMRLATVFFIAMLPPSIMMHPIPFAPAQLINSDRYYFLFSFFAIPAAVILCASLIRRVQVARVAYFAYLGLALAGTVYLTVCMQNATRVQQGIVYNFRYRDADTVLLLNLPHNYKGITMMPAKPSGVLNQYLKVLTRDSIRGKEYDVSSYNLCGPGDGAHVTVLDSMRLKVTLNQAGSWWWYGSYSAVDYENELYTFRLDQAGTYTLSLKRPLGKGTVLLFQAGTQLKKVAMEKVGVAQW